MTAPEAASEVIGSPVGDSGDQTPIVLDSSALLCRYLPDPRRQAVEAVIESTRFPVVTSLAHTEVAMGIQLAVRRTATQAEVPESLMARVAADWNRFWVVPIASSGADRVRVANFGATYGLNLANALHLSAIERLPRPIRLLTFDDRQVSAAAEIGIETIETETTSTAHGLLA